jgi:hypothetical protein
LSSTYLPIRFQNKTNKMQQTNKHVLYDIKNKTYSNVSN